MNKCWVNSLLFITLY